MKNLVSVEWLIVKEVDSWLLKKECSANPGIEIALKENAAVLCSIITKAASRFTSFSTANGLKDVNTVGSVENALKD